MKRRMLIICTGNSCRSQMAEGLVRYLSKGTMDVFSAGTHPSRVHPMAIRVMSEIGVDISHHTSKSINKFIGEEFDYVITVCDYAKAACPIFPGARNQQHIPFEDPVTFHGDEEQQLERFRQIRDQIKNRMEEFLKLNSPSKSDTSPKFFP